MSNIKWYKFNIQDLSENEYNKWYSVMSDEKKYRVDSFRFEDDKKRTVAGEMLARNAIAAWCNVMPEEISFGTNKNGKPFAENAKAQFNISHCGNMVVCAIADDPIGIDIEKIRPVSLKAAKRICTEDELTYLFGHKPKENEFIQTSDDATLIRFFEIWTAKEAYVKCIGTGIFDDLKSTAIDTSKTHRIFFKNHIITIYSTDQQIIG